uniref:Uncharacterized protein n=1 Tax=Rhizophora mucronata TaxID=61149 RepID=A0A2P2IXZ6_RHIMU
MIVFSFISCNEQ